MKAFDSLENFSRVSMVGTVITLGFILMVLGYRYGYGLEAAFYQPAISAGALGGALHALTGSDHITAVLPLAINKRWWTAASFGAVWGVGHGLTSFLLGITGSLMRGYLLTAPDWAHLQWAGDFVVAITLIIIGAMGIYENHFETPEDGAETDEEIMDIESASNRSSSKSTKTQSRKLAKAVALYFSALAHGASLGLTWDGLPSLAPALLLDHRQAVLFLSAYFVATIGAMAFFAAVLGEATFWVSRSTDPLLAHRLASLTSVAAVVLGVFWFGRAATALLFPATVAAIGIDEGNNDGSQLMLGEPSPDAAGAWLGVASLGVVLLVVWWAVSAPRFWQKQKVDAPS